MGLTVEQFAQKYDLSIDDLLDIAKSCDIELNNTADINDDMHDKLRSSIDELRGKVSLSRSKVSQLQVGYNRTVTVVTKKKRTKPKIDLSSIKKKIAASANDDTQTKPNVSEDKSTVSPKVDSESNAKEEAQSGTEQKVETTLENTEVKDSVVSDKETTSVNTSDEATVVKVEAQSSKEESKNTNKNTEKAAKKSASLKKGAKAPLSNDSSDDDSRKQKKKKARRSGGYSSESIDKTVLRKISGKISSADEALEITEQKKSKKVKREKHHFTKPVTPKKIEVRIPDKISVSDLAHQMSVKAVNVIKELMKMGVMATPSCVIEKDTAILVTEELGHIAIDYVETNPEGHLTIEYDCVEEQRAPIVTIMGHVDHGKTSLLDYIRRSSITKGESGGITQHIGAYSVKTDKGSITFLDTPGHSAFTSMRARGTKCTDVVIIVIAADDGVMPQTKEAIDHAKAAQVPIVIAFNKIDKPDVDVEKIKSQLAAIDLLPEDWGGDAPCIGISAKTGQGIDELLESILLQAELLDLKAPHSGPAQGVVIESSLHKQKGAVSTLLVEKGSLNIGDIVVCSQAFGRIKAMKNDKGEAIGGNVLPSSPVEVLGLTGDVSAGDKFAVVSSEKTARDIVDFRSENHKKKTREDKVVSLEDFFQSSNEVSKELTILLKADTHGSTEAIIDSLNKLSTESVNVKIVSSGIGGINESDVMLAKASSAIILGFNTRADKNARDIAEKEKVNIYYYSIIYDLLDNVKSSVKGLEGPKFKEEITGLCTVRDVFRSSVLGNIAGCLVTEGVIKKALPIRVLRNHVVIYEGVLESLRRFKDDVTEVRAGVECGIGVKDYNDIKVGDQIEVFEMIELKS